MKLTPFGKMVRQCRLEKEITLADMTKAIGVSAAFASAVETGSKSIPSDYPIRVARALDLNQAQTKELEAAAELSASEFKIPIGRKTSRADREVAAMFARRFSGLADQEKRNIRRILEGDEIE